LCLSGQSSDKFNTGYCYKKPKEVFSKSQAAAIFALKGTIACIKTHAM